MISRHIYINGECALRKILGFPADAYGFLHAPCHTCPKQNPRHEGRVGSPGAWWPEAPPSSDLYRVASARGAHRRCCPTPIPL